MESLAIYCADIGSIKRRNFAWACSKNTGTNFSPEKIEDLVRSMAQDLRDGSPVALGLECPLFIPVRDDPNALTSARDREGDRPWSGGPGANVLVTGLAQTVWILRSLKERVSGSARSFTNWTEFRQTGNGLFLWEAFVSKKAKRKTHADDAKAAVQYFAAHLQDLEAVNAIKEQEVYSLVGAALLRAGWSDEVLLLSASCLVLRPE